MAAGIVPGLDPAGAGVDDDHRLADVLVFDPVALVGDLLKPAGHLPHVRPEMLDLEVVEFLVEIALGRNALRIVNWKRYGSQASVC